MRTTIDKAGRVVIPAEVRRRAGLKPGTAIDVRVEEDASVRVVRMVSGPRLRRVGKRLVAKPTVRSSELPEIDVAALIDEERNRWPW